jgi:hypothetical protein
MVHPWLSVAYFSTLLTTIILEHIVALDTTVVFVISPIAWLTSSPVMWRRKRLCNSSVLQSVGLQTCNIILKYLTADFLIKFYWHNLKCSSHHLVAAGQYRTDIVGTLCDVKLWSTHLTLISNLWTYSWNSGSANDQLVTWSRHWYAHINSMELMPAHV